MHTYYKLRLALQIAKNALNEIDNNVAKKALKDIDDLYIRKHGKNNKISEGLLWCAYCKSYKPIDQFCKDKHNNTGYQNRCRECNKEVSKEYRRRKNNGQN